MLNCPVAIMYLFIFLVPVGFLETVHPIPKITAEMVSSLTKSTIPSWPAPAEYIEEVVGHFSPPRKFFNPEDLLRPQELLRTNRKTDYARGPPFLFILDPQFGACTQDRI